MPELGVTQLGCQVSLLEVILIHLFPSYIILLTYHLIPINLKRYTRVTKNPAPSKTTLVH